MTINMPEFLDAMKDLILATRTRALEEAAQFVVTNGPSLFPDNYFLGHPIKVPHEDTAELVATKIRSLKENLQ
jgi:hypothetical protein